MSGFTFPDFEVYLSSGQRLTKTEFASSSLSYTSAYGQAAQYTLSIVGDDAARLEASKLLSEGVVMREVKAGYRDDELVLLGRNLLIWESQFEADEVGGDQLTVTAYGCSQYVRQSGQRTEVLVSKTYAEAAKEVAARWGLPIRIGAGAYRAIPEKSAAQTASSVPDLPPIPNGGILTASSLANTQVLGMARRVAQGSDIGLDDAAKFKPNWCAWLVRQVVEKAIGGRWAVSQDVYAVTQYNDDVDGTNANDYAQSSRRLKLDHPGPPQPGDILFAEGVSLPWGHIGIFLGEYNGVPSVLENTRANRGVGCYGATSRARVTPLANWDAVTLIARAVKPPASTVGTSAAAAPKPAGDASSGLGGKGVTATSKPGTAPRGDSKPRRMVMQENESDWDFLTKIGREIGYIVSETDFGDELYFGPGLEIGARDRYLLVRGEYSVDGVDIPANISGLTAKRSLYGIPAELVVTGWENGKKFALVISPEDLADRQKIEQPVAAQAQTPKAGQPTSGTPAPSGDASSGLGGTGLTATSKASSVPAAPPKTPKSKSVSLGQQNFASSQVATLVSGAYPTVKRRVLGGASSKLDALERGLEALALEQLRYQEVEIKVFGIPTLRAGNEVVLQGSGIPESLHGLYLVRQVGGDVSGQSGYEMSVTLNRNTLR